MAYRTPQQPHERRGYSLATLWLLVPAFLVATLCYVVLRSVARGTSLSPLLLIDVLGESLIGSYVLLLMAPGALLYLLARRFLERPDAGLVRWAVIYALAPLLMAPTSIAVVFIGDPGPDRNVTLELLLNPSVAPFLTVLPVVFAILVTWWGRRGAARPWQVMRTTTEAVLISASMRVLVSILVSTYALAGCDTGTTDGGLTQPRCLAFDAETVEKVAWAQRGDFLLVTSLGPDGLVAFRVFGWPGMDKLSEVTDRLAAPYQAAIDSDGGVYWVEGTPLDTSLFVMKLGAAPESLSSAGLDFLSIGLIWSADRILTMKYAPGTAAAPERRRIVALDTDDVDRPATALTEWTSTRAGTTFWADRGGRWLLWDEFDTQDKQDFVISDSAGVSRIRPPGRGGGDASLTPDGRALMYRKADTSRLVLLDRDSGGPERELSDRRFFTGELSASGMLAAATAFGPGEKNEFCVLDVSAQLTSQGRLSPTGTR